MTTKTLLIIAFAFANICAFGQSEDMKVAMMLKDNPEARTLFNKYYETANRDSMLYFGMKLIEVLPTSYLGYEHTALVWYTKGDMDKSCPYFKKAFALGSTLSDLYLDAACRNFVPPNEKTAFDLVVAMDYVNALAAYKELKDKDSTNRAVTEAYLNRVGYDILIGKLYVNDSKEESFKIALVLFRIIVDLYPYSSNAYDSLGEAYFLNNDKANALINYKKSLGLDSKNENARQYIERLTN